MSVTISNANALSFFAWVIKRGDNLDQIVFLFVSKLNATNARYLPLFNETKNVRIVYLRGLSIKYTDILFTKLYICLLKFFRFKINRYNLIHIFNLRLNFSNSKQVLHIDDPTYGVEEINKILDWERHLNIESKHSSVICTNSTTYSWLQDQLKYSLIYIIEQGFHRLNSIKPIEIKNFSCVYSSPYIHFGTDKLANHSTYGANLLIEKIIPELAKIDPNIEVHLVGELGENAKKFLKSFSNVKIYGRVEFEKNIEILSSCSIGIYPRTFDHKRSMLKIFTYIGAGLPIVTFDLIDTKVVKEQSLGFSVKNSDEFVKKIVDLKNSNRLLSNFKKNVNDFGLQYSWDMLAKKMEILINHSKSNT